MKILVINCGSSSIKFRLFDMRDEVELAQGKIERLGEPQAEVSYQCGDIRVQVTEPVPDYKSGVDVLLRLLTRTGEQPPLQNVSEIAGVGHRVVHGGEKYDQSVVIDDQVLAAIREFCALAPLHNPANLAGIEAAMTEIPDTPQIAVFDTAFFQHVPPHAYIYALPYEWYEEKHIRRYGFHGTSHRYVSLVAAELLGRTEPNLVSLHLGSGCSAACIQNGRAIDHSMGMTPLEGLVMSTRCGDVDPALVFHLVRQGMDLEEIHQAMEGRGGLLGISGVSADMRDILAAAGQGHERARLAIDVFAYRARKYLGAYIAMLGKCDAVIFTGGIGERAAVIREKIIAGLAPIGIQLDPQRNEQAGDCPQRISTATTSTDVWVIPTNEELMIARDTWRLIRTDRH